MKEICFLIFTFCVCVLKRPLFAVWYNKAPADANCAQSFLALAPTPATEWQQIKQSLLPSSLLFSLHSLSFAFKGESSLKRLDAAEFRKFGGICGPEMAQLEVGRHFIKCQIQLWVRLTTSFSIWAQLCGHNIHNESFGRRADDVLTSWQQAH